MPKVQVNAITINYDQQGTGEPLILIPYLAADYACYAFQVAEYAKHFTCISVDLQGAGESDKPAGTYSTELFADDVAAFMQVLGIPQAYVAGLSLGAATGIWLAAKYPDRVKSLSLHSAWPKTDPFLKTAVESWQVMAQGLGSVPEMVIGGIFLWCFTPELYASRPEYFAIYRNLPSAAGMNHLMILVDFGALQAERVRASLNRLAREVMPNFVESGSISAS